MKKNNHVKILTPQQLEVARRILIFNTVDEIADNMGLAKNTTRVHIAAVLKKLGYASRFEMVRRRPRL